MKMEISQVSYYVWPTPPYLWVAKNFHRHSRLHTIINYFKTARLVKVKLELSFLGLLWN